MKVLLLFVLHLTLAASFPGRRPAEVVPDEFLIRLDENLITTEEEESHIIAELEERFNLEVLRSMNIGPLKILHVNVDEANSRLIPDVAGVKYIEVNSIGSAADCTEFPSPGTWGLDRIGQRERLPYTNPISGDAMYAEGVDTGEGGVAYVMDSGVAIENPEFGGRASTGFNRWFGPGDGLGHGTHIAGTIGGESHGIAKQVQLISVKVLNRWGFGTLDQVVGGLEYVLADHQARQGTSPNMPKSVINMSLSYALSTLLDETIEECVRQGIVVAVAADNNDEDACYGSPSRAPFAITVGASDVNDNSATFSNYGPCVDIYAPGVEIRSTMPGNGTEVKSGTSMSTPHVVGVVALYQSRFVSAPSPAKVQ